MLLTCKRYRFKYSPIKTGHAVNLAHATDLVTYIRVTDLIAPTPELNSTSWNQLKSVEHRTKTMDKLKLMASDAGTFLTRTVQYTEEKLGNAEKTELDARFENLQQRADRTKQWTETILTRTGAVLEPNPNTRMEDFVNTKLDRKVRDRDSNYENLGSAMIDAGNELGPGTQYGATLIQVGQTQRKLGQLQREFVHSSVSNYVVPLRNFLDGDMKTIIKERKSLENVRLDLDAAKSKLRKARSTEAVRTSDTELRKAQAEFDRQYEITTLLLEGVTSAHSTHLERLKDFVEAQQAYFAQCNQAMVELQQQLGKSSRPVLPQFTI